MKAPAAVTSLMTSIRSTVDDRFGRLRHHHRLVRAPIWFYRHGWGRVFGPGMLMLEHTGRISGRPRQACLQVAVRRSPGSLVVISGHGTTAQWYRNLLAHPDCRVTTARRGGIRAHARVLSDDESTAVLDGIGRAHPRRAERLRTMAEEGTGAPPMVELTLREWTPPARAPGRASDVLRGCGRRRPSGRAR
ncbi:nitroreductase family deazaflavin-dependent oxidoreductase [Gordonia sp. NPDC003376]